MIVANKDPAESQRNSFKKIVKTKLNKDGVQTSLLSIKNLFPKDLYQDVEAMNYLGKQLKNYKIINAYNVILGYYSPEL